jgi:hypothetical protein
VVRAHLQHVAHGVGEVERGARDAQLAALKRAHLRTRIVVVFRCGAMRQHMNAAGVHVSERASMTLDTIPAVRAGRMRQAG